jgi:carboxy-cis,cis-muconate cyclase
MDAQSLFSTSSQSDILHILSGSFNSFCLFLLAFSPVNQTISLVQKIDAFGPHQYIATNPTKTRAYTTSWSLPPVLSSWQIEREDSWGLSHISNSNITAVSSYITVPPPFTHAYSAGGPAGEVHVIDDTTGELGTKIQEILFVPEDQLEQADKTKVALVSVSLSRMSVI